jgi:hypothetical protein
MRFPRFDYVMEVPPDGRDAMPWTARLRAKTEPEPIYSDAYPPPAVGPVADVVLEDFEARVGVLRTRVRFLARDERDASFREVSFVVDRRFFGMLRPRDVISAAQSAGRLFGVSVMRDDYLVAAVGAVTAVPLGDVVTVRFPIDFVREVAPVYRKHDSRYRPREVPVEIVTEEGTRLMHEGRARFGRYEFFVVNGFVGGSECMAITCLGICPEVAATLTAPVINSPDSISVVPWKTLRDLRVERDLEVLKYVEQGRACLEGGDIEGAHGAAMNALWRDRACDAALRLLEDIERRR